MRFEIAGQEKEKEQVVKFRLGIDTTGSIVIVAETYDVGYLGANNILRIDPETMRFNRNKLSEDFQKVFRTDRRGVIIETV